MKLKSPKIYRNKRAKNHPGIEITSDRKMWRNMVVTHSPIKTKRYMKLHKNLNKKDLRESYIEKRIRNDPIRTRGKRLYKYRLSKEDRAQLEDYITKKVSVQPTKLGPSAPLTGSSNTNNNIIPKITAKRNKKS